MSLFSLILKFPSHVYKYIFGLFFAVISDITSSGLALGSTFIGCATNLWIGLASFFIGHTIIMIINATNNAIIQHSRLISESLIKVFSDQSAVHR